MAEQQLKELISSLKNQGILTDYIDVVRSLQDENNPHFLENLIPDFFTSTEKKIAKLTSNLSEADVNYSSMVHLAYEIKGEASYLACARLANVSKELGDASNAQNKDECLRLLDNVKSEYYYVKPHLNRIVKLERAIYENQQAGK
ncbi:histidine-containing phosphotransfer protein 3-like [Pyrus ussuriensis x Pyrus communis]|uniref:Histidine-containing phosphotransfer protein n=1 Tax=Pyrus ussuriensis x Pyrus communis TaxID=2448454 RepID=A0A5N5GM54_9ROSA|nr:histidine-containing phosphotransfer protein 3-like [Pyrus ussuriensis x Pyrus communis]